MYSRFIVQVLLKHLLYIVVSPLQGLNTHDCYVGIIYIISVSGVVYIYIYSGLNQCNKDNHFKRKTPYDGYTRWAYSYFPTAHLGKLLETTCNIICT